MSLISVSLYVIACAVAVSRCADVQPQIVGGTDSESVPFMVSLRDPNWYHICGGSIITNLYVLTCAHCTRNNTNATYVVGGSPEQNGGYYWTIVITKQHESFNNANGIYDIAVLKVNPPFTMSPTVATIPLAAAPSTGTTVTVFGWGWTNYNEQVIPNRLQKLNVTTISNSQCSREHRYYMTIHDRNVCTDAAEGKGICYGDSGSAVVHNNKQFGMVQRVRAPCATGYADVHERVWSYLNWITQNTAN